MTIPNINGKMIGDIAVKTVTTCAGLWATGFWVGWGFRSGARQSDMIALTRDIRRKTKALEEASNRLEKLNEMIENLDENDEQIEKKCEKLRKDAMAISSELAAVYAVCGGDVDPSASEILQDLQDIMVNLYPADEDDMNAEEKK